MKNSIGSARVVTNASMAADVTSLITNIQFLDNIYYQAIWSAGSTPVGVITVEVSASYDPTTNTAGTWDALTLPVTANVSGNSGSISLDLNQLSMPWIRLKYTRTSGSGTLNVYMSAKEV